MLTGGNIMIGILDDSIYENCQETFSVVLSTEDDRVRLAERIATVTIEDNDGKEVSCLQDHNEHVV